MDLSIDTNDLSALSRSPWSVALVLAGILGLVMWLLVDRVITREDEILEQGARVEQELAVSREELVAGMAALGEAFSAADRQMTLRAERWILAIDRLARIAAAQCLAMSNGDSESLSQCRAADTGRLE